MKHVLRVALSILVLISCEDKDELGVALVQTGDVTNIGADGALFSGKILSPGSEPIKEAGFVWSDLHGQSIELSEKTVVENASGVFSAHVTTMLERNKVYFVRAYILTNQTITYGREVSFVSLGSAAPLVLDFHPHQGSIDETIIIIGKNFSTKPASNAVKIGGLDATVLKATNDSIWIKIPTLLDVAETSVSVTVLGNKVTAESMFKLFAPAPDSFSPATGSFDQVVLIHGINFLKNPSSIKVFFNETAAEVLQVTDSEIRTKPPLQVGAKVSEVFVSMNNLKVKAPGKFELAEFTLSSFSPEVILTGGKITINGTNFVPTISGNIVKIGGNICQVVQATSTQLEVVIPLQNGLRYESRDATVTVESLGVTKSFQKTLVINDKWFRTFDFPGSLSYEVPTVKCGNSFFVGPNIDNKFYKFDPSTNVWTTLEDFPGIARNAAVIFPVGSKIYFGAGYELTRYEGIADFWQFDTQNERWTQRNDFVEPLAGLSAFSIGGKGYVLGGRRPDAYMGLGRIWQYDEGMDQFNELASPPLVNVGGAYGQVTVSLSGIALFGIGHQLAFPSNPKEVFKFNPANDVGEEWERITDFPEEPNIYYPSVGFEFNGNAVVKVSTGPFYQYKMGTNTWNLFPTANIDETKVFAGFSSGGKMFLILSNKEFWEYDPNR